MKILLTGGSGILGQEILKLNSDIYAPTRNEMDITDQFLVAQAFKKYKPNLVIHCAAYTNVAKAETNEGYREACIVNILGTKNIVEVCKEHNSRLIYISTDYVFNGDKLGGLYDEFENINPCNKYAETKYEGEKIVYQIKNSLVLRTSFCSAEEWQYKKAFEDQWTSRDTVDVIASRILISAFSSVIGILNIGTERKTVYELAKSLRHDVEPCSRLDVDVNIPKDTSLDCRRWENLFKEKFRS